MSVALLSKGLDNRHISKFNFPLRVLRKLRQPPTDLLLFVDGCGREWIFPSEGKINLSAKPLCRFTSLAAISIPRDMVSRFVNCREGEKERRPFLNQGLEPI
jgi:hypothetical protein